MIVVTGGAGFIGSNIVNLLNRAGVTDIVVVDDLQDGRKFRNIADCAIADYLDKDEFRAILTGARESAYEIDRVYHLGACSDTTEWNGRYMLDNNFTYSRELLEYCQAHEIPLVYASSAAVYGGSTSFVERPEFEKPLNVYGYSKLLFDNHVRRLLPRRRSQIVGLRYFNVYGPREFHKGRMASVALHLHDQLAAGDSVRLFAGSHGYGDGEQQRDFVYVEDAAAMTTWFGEHPKVSGIFNCGSGRSQPFNAVANAVIAWHKRGHIEYIPFPPDLLGAYQSFTQADMTAVRKAGCDIDFRSVEQGVERYLNWLDSSA